MQAGSLMVTFSFIKALAREEILANGGSISHHHGGEVYHSVIFVKSNFLCRFYVSLNNTFDATPPSLVPSHPSTTSLQEEARDLAFAFNGNCLSSFSGQDTKTLVGENNIWTGIWHAEVCQGILRSAEHICQWKFDANVVSRQINESHSRNPL